jgi:hypothetical protein
MNRVPFWPRVCLLVCLATGGCSAPERVKRDHRQAVSPEFEPLARRIEFSFPGDAWLTRREAERDLDQFEWLLENRYAYLTRHSVDYRVALDSIRASLGDGIRRGTFALQLEKTLALFGDGHSMVSDPALKTMCAKFLPFLVVESKGRWVVLSPQRTAFLDNAHPFLRTLDGRPVEDWLQAASSTVPEGSPQFVRRGCVGRLRDMEYLRKELSLPPSDTVQIELESAADDSRKALRLPLADTRPVFRPDAMDPNALPAVRVLPGNIGYLRIHPWMSDEPAFLDALVRGMAVVRETQGMIMDVRGNGGGSRAPLRTIFPFFLAPDAPPQVLNVAAYRLGHRRDVLDGRWLFSARWNGWSAAEKGAIASFAWSFVPAWQLPSGKFSDWNYFVISPSTQTHYYHYDRPLIILMDSANFSATDIFLGAFKGWTNVTLMGAPSGGGSGRYMEFRLQYSLIKIRLSSMASFQSDGALYDGNGIKPGVIVEPSLTDIIGTTDSVLDAACHLLE